MPAFMIAITTFLLAGLTSAFMPTAAGYGFFVWLTGIGAQGVFNISLLLTVELVSFKYKSIFGSIIHIPAAIGGLLLGLEAYLIRDWVTLHLVAHLPGIILLLLWFIIPESPRWLIATGCRDKVVKIIKKIAQDNGKAVPECLLYQSSNTKALYFVSTLQKMFFFLKAQ